MLTERVQRLKKVLNQYRKEERKLTLIDFNIDKFHEKVNKKLNYKIPKSYTQIEDLSLIITLSSIYNCYEKNWDYDTNYKYFKEKGFKDSTVIDIPNFTRITQKWFFTNSPIFLVTKDLIEKLTINNILLNIENDKSFLDKLVQKINIVFPNILFLFEKNSFSIFYEDDEFKVDNCFVSVSDDCEVMIYDKGDSTNINVNKVIAWTSVTDKTTLMTGGLIIPHNEIINDEKNLLNNLILQCLLLISSKPELIIEPDLENVLGKNAKKAFSSKNAERKKEKFLYPRILNLEYAERKIKQSDPNKSKGGIGSPKRPHWRLGYEVNKPIGKMKGVPREQWERKLIRVAPYFCLGNSDNLTDEEE